MSIRILNPVVNGYTSRRRAADYVLRGRARFVDSNTIEFLDEAQVRLTRVIAEHEQRKLREYDPVIGCFHWGVGVSDLHFVMQAKRTSTKVEVQRVSRKR